MPPFDHLHPAVVHFAIAPLVLAPALLLLALLWKSQRPGLLIAATGLLLAGTAAALLSQATGQAAERFARATPELRAALQVHEAAGLWVPRVALLATLLAAAASVVPKLARRKGGAMQSAFMALAMMCSLMAAAAALRTGHLGGIMVHQVGTHAKTPGSAM